MSGTPEGFDQDSYLATLTDELAANGTQSSAVQRLLQDVGREAGKDSEAFKLAATAYNLRRAYELEHAGLAEAFSPQYNSVSSRASLVFSPRFQAGFLITSVLLLGITGAIWSYSASKSATAQATSEYAHALNDDSNRIEVLENRVYEAAEALVELREAVQKSEDATERATREIRQAIADTQGALATQLGESDSGGTFAQRVAEEVASYLEKRWDLPPDRP